jgi:hypothetical protein
MLWIPRIGLRRRIKDFIRYKILRRKKRTIREIYAEEFAYFEAWAVSHNYRYSPDNYTVGDTYSWELKAMEEKFDKQMEESDVTNS